VRWILRPIREIFKKLYSITDLKEAL